MKVYSFKQIQYVLFVFILFLDITTIEGQSSLATNKTIYGIVSHLEKPLPNVNITIVGKSTGTKTNINGAYSIEATVGDIIKYTHIGLSTISIIVEDVTEVLNIEMVQKTNKLDEVVIKAKPKSESFVTEFDYNKKVKTAKGDINPMLLPTKVLYFKGNQLGKNYSSLSEALKWKVSRGIPTKFDVDGTLYNDDRFINLSRILDVYVVTGSTGTMFWGGPVVIVRTMDSPEEIEKRKEAKAEQYRNQNYYEKDAIPMPEENLLASNNTSSKNNTTPLKQSITGIVSYLGAPLQHVNISIVGKSIGTKTKSNGSYSLKANSGDIIQYSHLGFSTTSIIVEDITNVLNIEMVRKENQLDEVVVKANMGKTLERVKKANKKIETSRGIIDPEKSGYAISYIDGEDINPIHGSLAKALRGKVAGFNGSVKSSTSLTNPSTPIWDVDGVIFPNEPPLDLNNIKSVHILKTLAGTTRYGSAGANGVIVVTTKYGSFDPEESKRKQLTEKYANKNFYANDAINISEDILNQNSLADNLEKFNNQQQAFMYYDQTIKNRITDHSTLISIALKFSQYYKNLDLSKQVLLDAVNSYNHNPEILKTLAYYFQALNLNHEAVNVYEQIFKLRPSYAQSYRDLANAYVENNQFKRAWRLYMSYLIQGNDVSGEGIGELFYDEMEFLYFNRKNQTDIKEKFVPKSKDLFDFRNDVRLVFEWNTSEAEFDLEFVSPDLRSYVFEHTLASNEALIIDEKQKGYSSHSYFIDDLKEGEWLVNLTYKGNKKPEPTYLKLTRYYNWGKTNQEKIITVYKLYKERHKMQLLNLNKQVLVATN